MTEEQQQQILVAWEYCDEEDKSTEFMLQYMSDVSGVDYDEVVDFVSSQIAQEARKNHYLQNEVRGLIINFGLNKS